MDCFGTYFTHAQTCDYVRVQSATQWTASVHTLNMPKPVITFVFKVLRNGLLRYILYTCQTCDYVRVQSATQWTASVHTLHMPKHVITFVFKVLHNGLLRSPTSGSRTSKVCPWVDNTGHTAWPIALRVCPQHLSAIALTQLHLHSTGILWNRCVFILETLHCFDFNL